MNKYNWGIFEDTDHMLHLCVIANKTEQVAKLIDEGADLEEYNAYGNTPLGAAAIFGSVDCARILLEKGAKINTVEPLCIGLLIRKKLVWLSFY